jgi:FkbM family methyltransferase
MPGTLAYQLRDLLDRVNIDLLIDVGGYEGEYGKLLRAAGYRGPIVSYDPAPAVELLDCARKDGAWTVRPVACSDAAGTATLHRYPGMSHAFNSLHTETSLMAERFPVGTARQTTVETVRLDSEPFEAHDVFLKIDTQGHDLHVLEGAAGILDRVRLVQMELSVLPIYEQTPPFDVAVGRVRDLGFTPTGFFPITSMDGMRVIEFDGVFIRAR